MAIIPVDMAVPIHRPPFILRLPKGSIVVVDRAYNDYLWFRSLCEAGIFFVTRQKSNAVYQTVWTYTSLCSVNC